LDKDTSLQAGFDQTLAGQKLSAQRKLELNYLINSFIEQEYAADVADLSLWYWDEGEDFDGGDVLFPGGYDQVFRAWPKAWTSGSTKLCKRWNMAMRA
jgi:hypothetical protein